MKNRLLIPTLSLAMAFSVAAVLQADVKKEEKNLVTFSGMLGRMANLFGGKAAKEGVVSTVAVSGNRPGHAAQHLHRHNVRRAAEQSGGLVMTADNWMTKSVPAFKEITDFDMRYYKALAGPQVAVDAQQLTTALAMMPGLKDAFARMQRAGLDGTAISSTTTVESVKSPEQNETTGAVIG
jgi:hypothetical protein